MTEWPHIVVAGGSIGGLTAALLLRDLGCEVDVFERSSEALQSRGAGIVVLPMTERYFVQQSRTGERVSLTLTYWSYVDAEGNLLSADPDSFRFSSWNTVYRGLLDCLDPDRYHLNEEMVGFDRNADGVTVRMASGREIEADLLVCADGTSSTARRLLLPDIQPVYAGYVAWRGTVPERQLSPTTRADLVDSMLYQVLVGGHILTYAIAGQDGAVEPGDRLINFVWYRNYPEGEDFDSVMTDVHGERRPMTVPPGMVRREHLDELRRATRALAPTMTEVVNESSDVFVQAIFDLESPRLVFGRVLLMGDAAFTARPHVAAGTAKASADAWALHDALRSTHGGIDAALATWEPGQLALGRAVVDRSRRMGQSSQFEGTMVPGDPAWKFGLYEPGN
ncbi:MAG: FAD binding domain-containing protein [Acidimicrobiia bacterium]|nr:FAD binding domain-containing protein [Acidimicrobiia bacterium]MDH3397187.1 FAD binding domain-containing protein [Acidimicrobiia bacterium]